MINKKTPFIFKGKQPLFTSNSQVKTEWSSKRPLDFNSPQSKSEF